MRTSFHYQPEAQHPNSSALHKLPADYPIFGHKLLQQIDSLLTKRTSHQRNAGSIAAGSIETCD